MNENHNVYTNGLESHFFLYGCKAFPSSMASLRSLSCVLSRRFSSGPPDFTSKVVADFCIDPLGTGPALLFATRVPDNAYRLCSICIYFKSLIRVRSRENVRTLLSGSENQACGCAREAVAKLPQADDFNLCQ
eukprot:g65636.t1